MKNKERIQKFKETEIQYIFIKLHDMAYGDFKDLPERTASVLRDKAFNIPKNPKYDGYQRGLTKYNENVYYKIFN